MKYKYLFLVFLLSRMLSAESWIDKNIELTINGKFDDALNLLRNKIEKDSTDFQAYFYLAATLNSKMTHFENIKNESEFYAAIDKTIQLIGEKNKDYFIIEDSVKAQYLFYLGSAYGYRGFFEGKKGNWYAAMSDGLKAIDLLEDSVQKDSTLFQAYLGIGTYDYWASSKLKFALWLPFVPDNRDNGIELIKKSLKTNGPAKYMAMHQLVYILIDYGMFGEAEKYAEEIVKKYPNSQFMWWAYAHVYYKQREYKKAISSYKYLLELIQNSSELNPAHIIKCNLKLAQLYLEIQDYENCILFCNNILNSQYLIFLSEKLNNEIAETKQYLETASIEIKNE